MSFADIIAKKMQKTLEKNIKNKTLTPENMESFFKDLRIILLEADVNFKVVKTLINEIKTKATGEFIKAGLDPTQMITTIIHEEFSKIMGDNQHEIEINKKPFQIMVAGLQGSGKTTTIAKLAYYITKKLNKKCLLVAGDMQRLAAVEQLKSLGKKLNIDVYSEKNATAVKVAENAQKYALKKNYDVVLFDTAGRLQIDIELMSELKTLQRTVNPDETLLVIDGMAGQEMINIAESFINQINVKGFIISKMDGSARGGIALSLSYLTNKPIKFLGTGEKPEDLELFYPKRMADRILGMGDINSLLEKVEDNLDNRDIQATMDRMMLGQFDLNDLLNNLRQMKKMGKMSSLAKMLPGVSTKISDEKMQSAEAELKVAEVIIASTTNQERIKPQLLRYPSRKKRVLIGSGRSEKELNKLLGQYERTKKMMDHIAGQIKQGEMPNLPSLDAIMKGAGE